jgi:NADH pyrophosphatase NudC (nudix superfamily)
VCESVTGDGEFRLHWRTAETEPGEMIMDPGEVSDARWVRAEEFLTMEPTFAADREFFVQVLPQL